MRSMQEEREVDVGKLLENRPVGRFHLAALGLCLLILFVDGLDYSAANVAAPAILREFRAERSAMAAVFSWGYAGMFAGSILFGSIGDRYGRKAGAILGVLAYSIPALITVFATTLDALMALRFLAGLGIGGVIPNTVALLTETAPRRLRMTAVMASFIGYSTGNFAIAQVAAWLLPASGWQVVFLVAGSAGVALSVLLLFTLPESIPFLAAADPGDRRLRRLVARLAPELTTAQDTRFVFRRPANEMQFSLRLLFSGFRRVATPLIWLAFFAESLTYMSLSAWLTVILETAGLTPRLAALAYSFSQLGAIAAILLLARLLDRIGPKASMLSASLAVLGILSLGISGLSPALVIPIAVFALASASATHQSLNGMVGSFYPTVVRGNGIGYATGMGRIAAIAGPLIAGYLSPHAVLYFIAFPDLVVALACLGLDRAARTDLWAHPSETAMAAAASKTNA